MTLATAKAVALLLVKFGITLEGHIKERTEYLEIGAEMSRQLTAILDFNELLQYVVNHLQNDFDFYYVHIYLVEKETGDLVMVEGSGEVGRKLKARGHRLRSGQGIVGAVVNTNEHFLSNDVDQTPNFFRNPLLPDTNSELAVPLRKRDQVLGVLDVQSQERGRFGMEDIALMQSIANQLAIAIDNARLMSATQSANIRLEERTQQLETIVQISRQLTGTLKLDDLLRYVVNRLQSEFNFYHVHIYLVDEETGDLVMYEGSGDVGQQLKAKGHRLQAGKGIVGTVSRTNQHFLCNDVDKVSNFVRNPLLPHTNSELAVPLRKGELVLGVLDIQSEQRDNFSPDEVSLMQSIADQAAIAIDNARLLADKQATIVKLQEVDRLKSEFLTTMSHELRTPLNSILGFADILLQGIDGDLGEYALNDIQLIYNSGQHLLALINDILDISKIEAGMMEIVPDALEIDEVTGDIYSTCTLLVKDKPVEIIFDIPADLPKIYADKTRLKQILLNLVNNAIKFTHHGSVTVQAKISEQFPDKMYFTVTDTGIGIPAEKQQTLFERFKQADMSKTRIYGGTGLGLAICKKLVQMHGGEIGFKSQANVGSEFYFTIPLVKENMGVMT